MTASPARLSSTAFAIPINRAVRLAQQISNGQESANVHVGDRGLLGVRVHRAHRNPQAACQGHSHFGSARRRLGIRLTGSCSWFARMRCLIQSVAGKNIATTSDLNAAMFPYHPGETVPVRWIDQSGKRTRPT